MGLNDGSGALHDTDHYDHIAMIDACGGMLDQDYEMLEQQTLRGRAKLKEEVRNGLISAAAAMKAYGA